LAADLFASGADELLARLESEQRQVRREGDRLRRVDETASGLEALSELAEAALTEDPKLAAALAELRAIRVAEPTANVLVYTEYTDSQDALVGLLKSAVDQGDLAGEILTLSGADPEQVRTRVTERFGQEDALILVARTRQPKGSTCSTAATICSTWSYPTTPTAWSSATAASTATASGKRPWSVISTSRALSRSGCCCA
jgi:hypothetical protein